MFRNPYALGGFFLLTYLVLKSSARNALEGFSVESAPIRDVVLSAGQTRVDLDLELKNTNYAGTKVDSLAGSLIYGEFSLASLSLREPVEVPAQGSVLVPVSVTINHLKLATSILNIVLSGSFLSSSRAVGTIQLANGLLIPFDVFLLRFG